MVVNRKSFLKIIRCLTLIQKGMETYFCMTHAFKRAPKPPRAKFTASLVTEGGVRLRRSQAVLDLRTENGSL